MTYARIERLAPDKPMIIGETASSERGGSKAAWITAMFNRLSSYRNIRGLIWFDYPIGGKDWPLTSSLASLAAFKAGVASSAFVSTASPNRQPRPLDSFRSASVRRPSVGEMRRSGAMRERDALLT